MQNQYNFDKLIFSDGHYQTSNKVNFEHNHVKRQYINKVFQYSYQSIYNGKSPYFMGNRNIHEVFANVFKGKLAQFCVYSDIKNFANITQPKIQYIKDKNDGGVDLYIQKLGVNVKSSNKNGELFLLKSSDWNPIDASYKYSKNDQQCEIFILVRINPDSFSIMKDLIKYNVILQSNYKDILYDLLLNIKWQYDIPGWINRQHLKYIMNNNYYIKQGSRVGDSKREFRHDCYYIQANNLLPISQLQLFLNKF